MRVNRHHGKLGIEVKDLFYNGLLDPRQRREALQRRAKEQAAQRTADKATGRNTDLLKHAEYLVQSARGMTIDTWTPAQLDKRLNCLADAYAVLEGNTMTNVEEMDRNAARFTIAKGVERGGSPGRS